jgi:DNA repair protein RecN (Recombination protein N)
MRMLLELSISNFAIIEQLQIAFSPGLNVITGETGAGKSILLAALGLLCGQRVKSGAARNPEKPIWVEALFSPGTDPKLGEALINLGLEKPEEEFLIRREILPTGRNRVSLNGHLLRVGDLQTLSAYLVNVHSQFDTYQLLDSRTHFDFLKGLAQEEFKDLFTGYTKIYSQYRELVKRRETAEQRSLEIERTREHLESEINEISIVSLRIGEEEELNREHQSLANQEKIASLLIELKQSLDRGEENSLVGVTHRISALLESLKCLDDSADSLYDSFEDLRIRLEEFCDGIGNYQSRCEQGSERSLDDVESRIGEVEKLKRKYGIDISAILSYEKEAAEALFELGKEQISLEKLDKDIEESAAELIKISGKLLKMKKRAAVILEERVNSVLKRLALPGAQFLVNFECNTSGIVATYGGDTLNLGPEGSEKVEFYFSSHQSQEPAPLKTIASGGEISRVMLALKACFASIHSIQSFIFDEIDTGIGGETAHDLAQVLTEVSKDRQSIVITHLPQIAVCAQEHFKVERETRAKEVFTQILCLSREQAREEVGRMMGVRASDSQNRQKMAKILEEQVRGESNSLDTSSPA